MLLNPCSTLPLAARRSIMLDQAFKLRELIRSAVPSPPALPAGLPIVVVSGSRAGVGATTVAVNLAAALADLGERIVLVDAAERPGKLIQVAGVSSRVVNSLQDVVSGRCRAVDAVVPGPVGTMLLPGGGSHGDACFSRHAQQRLLAELQTLENTATLLVVDCGAGLSPWMRRFWLRAKLVTLVTTADDSAMLDSYAAIKRAARDAVPADIHLLVNQCDSEKRAVEARRRLSAASERFLSRSVAALPALPRYVEPNEVAGRAAPRAWESPNSPFGHAVLWLGRAVSDVLQLESDVKARDNVFRSLSTAEYSRS
jgi:flagellar biosynthesis protein FlhG